MSNELCGSYDQISDRTCRYYKDHGGRCHFPRLDHDCSLERELRRELDETIKALKEALGLFDGNWCPEYGHSPTAETFDRATKLWKRVDPASTREKYP